MRSSREKSERGLDSPFGDYAASQRVNDYPLEDYVASQEDHLSSQRENDPPLGDYVASQGDNASSRETNDSPFEDHVASQGNHLASPRDYDYPLVNDDEMLPNDDKDIVHCHYPLSLHDSEEVQNAAKQGRHRSAQETNAPNWAVYHLDLLGAALCVCPF